MNNGTAAISIKLSSPATNAQDCAPNGDEPLLIAAPQSDAALAGAEAAVPVELELHRQGTAVHHHAQGVIQLDYHQGPPATTAPTKSLKQRALNGTFWTLAGYAVSQLIRFASNIILARLLIPQNFALANYAGMILSGLQQFSDVGIGPAIIQNPRGDETRFLNTAWTMSFIRGVGLWAIACLIAWPVAHFYREPALLPIFLATALNSVISGLNSTSIFSLTRHLQLKKITLLNLSGQVLTTVVMIAIAVHPWGRNAWAIVIAGLVNTTYMMVVSHLINPSSAHRPDWDPSAVRGLFKMGKWIVVSTMLTFFAGQTDMLMLPRLFAMSTAGIYWAALTLQRMPTEIVGRVAAMTLFPALARCAEGPAHEFRRRVILSRSLILPWGVASMIGLGLGAPIFFGLFYKYEWLAAGWMCQFLVLNAWALIMQMSADRALLAMGHSRPLAISNAANFAVTVAACLLGKHIGEQLRAYNPVLFANAPLQCYILGAGAGNLAGHITIEILLARQGIYLFLQDLWYTALLAAALVAGLAPKYYFHVKEGTPHAIVMAIDLLLLAAASLWAGLRVLNYMRPAKETADVALVAP